MAKHLVPSAVGPLMSRAPMSPKNRDEIAALVAALPGLDLAGLALCWRNHLGGIAPAHFPR